MKSSPLPPDSMEGPALMAVWFKAPPPTARCLSPQPGFESRLGVVRKLPVTWGKVVVFAGNSGFLHYLQLASYELATIGINVTKNEIPKKWQAICLGLIVTMPGSQA